MKAVTEVFKYKDLDANAKEYVKNNTHDWINDDINDNTTWFKENLEDILKTTGFYFTDHKSIHYSCNHCQGDGASVNFESLNLEEFLDKVPTLTENDYFKKFPTFSTEMITQMKEALSKFVGEVSLRVYSNSFRNHYVHPYTLGYELDYEIDESAYQNLTEVNKIEQTFSNFEQEFTTWIRTLGNNIAEEIYDIIDACYSDENLEGLFEEMWFDKYGKMIPGYYYVENTDEVKKSLDAGTVTV